MNKINNILDYWYKKGWNDKIKRKSSILPINEDIDNAYKLGNNDASVLDDYRKKEEIISIIINK